MMRRSLRKDEHKVHCWILWNVARDLSRGVNSGSNKDDINWAKIVMQKAASMYKLDHKSMFVNRSVIEKRSFVAKWFYVLGFEFTNRVCMCVCVFFFFYRFRRKSYSSEAMNKLWEHTNGSDEYVLVRGQNFMKKASWNECGGVILWNIEIGYRHVQVILFSSDMGRYAFSARLDAWVYVTLMRSAAEHECSLVDTFLNI